MQCMYCEFGEARQEISLDAYDRLNNSGQRHRDYTITVYYLCDQPWTHHCASSTTVSLSTWGTSRGDTCLHICRTYSGCTPRFHRFLPDWTLGWPLVSDIKTYYQAFFWVLIDLIVELLVLIIKPFDNQTESWNPVSNDLIIKSFWHYHLIISESDMWKRLQNVYSQIKQTRLKPLGGSRTRFLTKVFVNFSFRQRIAQR